MKVSVNLGSSRPGGIDISFSGLARQTFQDFEIVFVDGLYHQRHERVLDLYRQYGGSQPLYHVPNHRNRSGPWKVMSSGFNTGFMLSEGEIVIMLMDYAYVPPNWIESHLRYHDRKRLVMGPHEYLHLRNFFSKDGLPVTSFSGASDPMVTVENISAQSLRFDDISIFEKMFTAADIGSFPPHPVCHHADPKNRMQTGPALSAFMHTKNESFPLESALSTNGMDEHYDLGRGPGDTDFGHRLTMQGLESWVASEAGISCLNPRDILPNVNLTIPESDRLPPPYDFRWSGSDGYRYYLDRRGRGEANNPYSLRQKRDSIWNWRELSQQKEASIPLVLIPDEEYYQ